MKSGKLQIFDKRTILKKSIQKANFILSILEICKTEAVEKFVFHQQRKYLAHLIRRDDNSPIKRLLFNNDRNSRPGRTINWKSNIITKEECSETVFYSRAVERKY